MIGSVQIKMLTTIVESCYTDPVLADGGSRLRGIATLGPVLESAARRFGTPLYVVDMVSVAVAAAEVESAFPPPWLLHYSLKANNLPAITQFLCQRGWGAGVVSTGEWQHARTGGVDNRALTFEGIGKTDAQLDYAVREIVAGRPLRWLSLESAQEARRLRELAAWHGLGSGRLPPADVLVRLNPQVRPETRAEFAVGARTSKFGMSREDVLDLARSGDLDGKGLRLRGVHVHVGSDLRDVGAWADAGVRAARLLAELAPHAGGSLDTINFGGGFPIAADDAPPPARFRAALSSALRAGRHPLPARPAIEPGRFLVGGSGWLVSSVLHSRQRRPAQQAVLDAGMTELIRPALYGSHHPAHALPAGSWPADALWDTALEGPVCESTDSFGTHRLPLLQRGDLVAIQGAGAYAASFTSRYNGRPQPTEVLLWADGTLQRCDRPPLIPGTESPDDVPGQPLSPARTEHT
jgi:diaminopimelate decarboxylase